MRRHAVLRTAALTSLNSLSSLTWADGFPAEAVRLVVPSVAGGTTAPLPSAFIKDGRLIPIVVASQLKLD